MNKDNVPEHEKLFDEICGKLSELTQPKPIEKIQYQLKKSQEDWISTQDQIQQRMKTFETYSMAQGELAIDLKKISDQLEQERTSTVRLSGELAKALELNLKLQFDLEESRAKWSQQIAEERKHNNFLVEKKSLLGKDLDLSQAVQSEIKTELNKAKEKYQQDVTRWELDRLALNNQIAEIKRELDQANLRTDEQKVLTDKRQQEVLSSQEQLVLQLQDNETYKSTLTEFENHAQAQSDMIKKLSAAAEHKMVELKVALDKKNIESNDYYGHLQQSLTQVQVLKQENLALKEYITKMAALYQAQRGES